MPEIHIKRKKQLFVPFNCCFRVFIDDEKLSTLSNGDDDKLTIAEGKHIMQIRNNYFSTRKVLFEIKDNQIKVVETSSVFILGWLYYLAPIFLLIYASLKLFGISLPSFVAPVAITPFFLFIILALLFGLFKKAILLKGIK